MRQIMLCISLLILSACTDQVDIPFVNEPPASTTKVKVLSVSLRNMDETGALTGQRSDVSHYILNEVSIPPTHKTGKVERPRNVPNPNKHFVISKHQPLQNKASFLKELRTELKSIAPKDREIILFVHGYNTSHTFSAFRAAQMRHDFEVPGVVMTYSWPSAAHPLAYSHDRDSVLYSRDNLQETLEMLHRNTGARILVVGHSMGTFLLMETLRQIEIARPGWTKKALSGIALMSPDISVDVFKKQASRFKALPEPFVIFSSQKDPALRLSARVNAVQNRLGNISDVSALGDLPVTLVDVTGFSQTGVNKHNVVGSSPGLISLIRKNTALGYTFDEDVSGDTGLLTGTILRVRNATQVILGPSTSQSER